LIHEDDSFSIINTTKQAIITTITKQYRHVYFKRIVFKNAIERTSRVGRLKLEKT